MPSSTPDLRRSIFHRRLSLEPVNPSIFLFSAEDRQPAIPKKDPPTSCSAGYENCVYIARRITVQSLIYIVMWRSRNEAGFGVKTPSVSKVLDEVKMLSFLWIKNRARRVTFSSSEEWTRFNFM
ncbi:hypothetical protein HanRHA438_Chr10g0467401 [Helianthus annuus]|nr:hypothetical protein HanRHA438_Chr10g0467401 [Helianthus annuus]